MGMATRTIHRDKCFMILELLTYILENKDEFFLEIIIQKWDHEHFDISCSLNKTSRRILRMFKLKFILLIIILLL